MSYHYIYTMDSRNLKPMLDKSINLIVTSPPYPMIEMWDGVFISQDNSIEEDLDNGLGISAFDKMHSILDETWEECDRVLADGGFICINIGDAVRTLNSYFCMYPNHVRVVDFFLKKGYSVLPDIHWRKQTNAPNKFMGSGMLPAGAYVTYEHEYILIFRKGDKREFSDTEKSIRRSSAYFWEERNTWFSDLWDIKGTAQDMKTDGTSRNRNASFPFEIPYRLVNMYSMEGDWILDPFAGLGTTNLACMACNRNSVGIDIDSGFSEIARNRLLMSKDFINEVVSNRLKQHSEFIESLTEEKKSKCYKNKHLDCLVKTRQEVDIYLNTVSNVEREVNFIRCNYDRKEI